MNFEKRRLRTFLQFPNEYLNVKTLAENGFYYTGENETCKCYFCGVEIHKWNIFINPLVEHWRSTNNCPILVNKYVNNVPYNLK